MLGLAGLARAATTAAPQATKFLGKNGGDIADLTADFFKNDDNKDKLNGKKGKDGLIQGFKDLMNGMSDDKKDILLGLLKNGMGMSDEAFKAFSTMFKGGKFSDIPTDQLLQAGKFLYEMVG